MFYTTEHINYKTMNIRNQLNKFQQEMQVNNRLADDYSKELRGNLCARCSKIIFANTH